MCCNKGKKIENLTAKKPYKMGQRLTSFFIVLFITPFMPLIDFGYFLFAKNPSNISFNGLKKQ